MEKTRCQCGETLISENCTLITGTCDDCLANQAADDLVFEWENGIGFE